MVIGATGLLGKDLVAVASRMGWDVDAPASYELDITSEGSVAGYLECSDAQWIVNCAAYTDVDGAESHPEAARSLNDSGPGYLGRFAEGRRIIHVSTDFVFDGSKESPYVEADPVNPMQVYCKTKLAGERALSDVDPTAIIVRTAWLYGAARDCFPSKMIRMAQSGKPLRVVDDRYGSPTYSHDLATAIMHLATIGPAGGIYNVVNSGQATWYDLAAAAITAAGAAVELQSAATEDFPAPADRPKYSVLDTGKYQSLGLSPLPYWTDAIRRYVDEMKFKRI
jgi:dTDP-4-dehydrorhamnose reductase